MNKDKIIMEFLKEHRNFIINESLSNMDNDSNVWMITGNKESERFFVLIEFGRDKKLLPKNNHHLEDQFKIIQIPHESNITVENNLRLIICEVKGLYIIYSFNGHRLYNNVDQEHMLQFKESIKQHLF